MTFETEDETYLHKEMPMRSMMHCLMTLAAAAMLAGCNPPPQTAGADKPPTDGQAGYLAKGGVKTEDGASGSAIESALAWSEKHAKVTEELLKAQQQRQELEEANKKLTVQVTKLQSDADNTQKELSEANQMLVEMRRELDSWKQNVLGFRDEIRESQKAQMDAMRRLMIFLGAEAPAAATNTARSTTQPASAPAGH
jgi:septal ring factor EnvC (AmiA/AmiB activator)